MTLFEKMRSAQMCLARLAGLDIIANYVDGRMVDGYTKQLDKEILDLSVKLSLFDDVFLIGLLSATFEYKQELPSRTALYQNITDYFTNNYGLDPYGLLEELA